MKHPDFEIWLYGSRARGTADEASDTDLLVVGDARGLSRARSAYRYPRVVVSHYEWSEARAMWSYGSLFLHHLKTEGIALEPGAGRLQRLLADLPPFTRARHDLKTFRQAAAEARRSLGDGGWPDLELQVMATVIRHAAILGSYCAGTPDYGRETPFATVGRHLGLAESATREIARLATHFRYLPIGDKRWEASTAAGLDWLDRVDELLSRLGPLIDGYERLLHAAA